MDLNLTLQRTMQTMFLICINYLRYAICGENSEPSGLFPEYTVKVSSSSNSSNLDQLPELVFSANTVIEIENELEVSMTTLKLDLSKRQITYISDKLANFVPILKDIDLSCNRIEYIPPSLERKMFDVYNLNLSDNLLTLLDRKFGVNLVKCDHLSLSQNMLSSLPKSFNNCFQNLIILKLNENQLYKLDNNFGMNMNSLKILKLYKNRLSTLTKVFGTGFRQLISLNLADNILVQLGEKFGNNMANLELLELSENQLTSLPVAFCMGFSTLKHLELSFNQISILPKNFGKMMSNIQFINLNHNKLTSLPASFNECFKTITTLSLSNNRLSTLDSSFGSGMVNLSELNLSHNNLGSLPETFTPKQSSSTNHHLGSSPMHMDIDDEPFSFKNLEILNFSHNKLKEVPVGFGESWTKLTLLNLSHNNLCQLPENFGKNWPNLCWLNLSNNLLTDFNINFFNKLDEYNSSVVINSEKSGVRDDTEYNSDLNETLSPSNSTSVEYFISSGNSWNNLAYLNLSHNQLVELNPDFFYSLKSIEKLSVSHNNLKALPEYFGNGMFKITHIDLSHNNLETLPPTLLNLSNQLELIDISHNKELLRQLYKKKEGSIGLFDWLKKFGTKLIFDDVNQNEELFIKMYDQLSLRFNMKKLRLMVTDPIEVEENRLKLEDFKRIIRKFENFCEVQMNGAAESDLKVIDLFKGIERIELEEGDEDLDINQRVNPDQFSSVLMNYITDLFETINECKQRGEAATEKLKLLDVLGGIFVSLDKSNNMGLIQSSLLILLSAIQKCYMRKSEEFWNLYLVLHNHENYKSSIHAFIKYHLYMLKEKAFNSVFLSPKDSENVHLIDFYYYKLKDKIGLREKPIEYTYEYIKSNDFAIISNFYAQFTPDVVIRGLVKELNENLRESTSLYYEMLDFIGNARGCGSDELYEFKINKVHNEIKYTDMCDLIEEYLIKQEILIKDS